MAITKEGFLERLNEKESPMLTREEFIERLSEKESPMLTREEFIERLGAKKSQTEAGKISGTSAAGGLKNQPTVGARSRLLNYPQIEEYKTLSQVLSPDVFPAPKETKDKSASTKQ